MYLNDKKIVKDILAFKILKEPIDLFIVSNTNENL